MEISKPDETEQGDDEGLAKRRDTISQIGDQAAADGSFDEIEWAHKDWTFR